MGKDRMVGPGQGMNKGHNGEIEGENIESVCGMAEQRMEWLGRGEGRHDWSVGMRLDREVVGRGWGSGPWMANDGTTVVAEQEDVTVGKCCSGSVHIVFM
ncbi:hypothetical protein ACFE04_020947 [Oxalis oulophora]